MKIVWERDSTCPYNYRGLQMSLDYYCLGDKFDKLLMVKFRIAVTPKCSQILNAKLNSIMLMALNYVNI